MTTTLLATICDFSVINQGESREITGIFCGDLLSWAMGRAKEGDAWCTVMGNANTIAVSTLADCACVILCHNSTPDDAFCQKAKQQEVCVLKTSLPEFEAALAVHKALQKDGA